jgi:cytochrome c553
MKRVLVVILVVAFAVAGATLFAGGDVDAGKAVFTKKCAACHGKEGEGKPALAKALKVEIRHLGSKAVQDKTDEVLRKESVEGVGKMKPVKGMSDADVDNLIAFLRTLKE